MTRVWKLCWFNCQRSWSSKKSSKCGEREEHRRESPRLSSRSTTVDISIDSFCCCSLRGGARRFSAVLLTRERTDLFREATLVAHNTILTLGQLAIGLKDVQNARQAISARFQQCLGEAPPAIARSIIDQLGRLLMSSLVSLLESSPSSISSFPVSTRVRRDHASLH